MREKLCFWLFNLAIKLLPKHLRCQKYITNCMGIGYIGYNGKALPKTCPDGENVAYESL
jgi:hypothetical protein